MLSDEREQVKELPRRLATGEEAVSGRALCARVAAARRLEMMTRDGDLEPPEPVQETADHPVDEHGCFSLPYPEMWMLWRTMPCHGYAPGSAAEARAIEQWREQGGEVGWHMAGRPWSRSEWEADPTPWQRALSGPFV